MRLHRVSLGDLAVVVLFLTVGSINHSISPWDFPFRYLDTLTPFLVGWTAFTLIASYLDFDPRSVIYALTFWIFTASTGLFLRSTELFHGDSPLPFTLVIFIGGGVSVLCWRTVHLFLSSKKSPVEVDEGS